MFDDVVRTLGEVRHVLDLWKNLISLVTLDAHGSRYKSEGGVMKVTKDAMVVMKGLKLSGNIYTMFGTTIVCGATVLEVESDSTVLWHIKMGHMGEHGMLVLHMRNLLKGVKSYKLDLCKFYVLGN